MMLPYAVRFDVGDSMAEAVKLFTGFQSDCAQTTTGVDKCSK
ncbi:unnamed protein product [Anisakis simplex]|uniref:Uncharacterized protein n=1 Tax=Anisakis simplex TaxID=6269 RepID=A0A3P6PR28_ANISI|nr:unnamed protein product [Anisakis simplex]